jgi:hypothetical protein
MRGVRRLVCYTLIACAALSLALCAACVFFQVKGGERGLISTSGPRGIEVRTYGGKLVVSWRAVVPNRPAWAGQINRYGFRYTRWSDGSGEVGMPLWLAAAVLAVMGVGIVYLARPARAGRAAGRCAGCGYDLRATPDRCPECGRVAAGAKGAA